MCTCAGLCTYGALGSRRCATEMSKLGGYAGSVLYVDLSKGEVEKKPLHLELVEPVKNYISGLGASLKLLC